MLYIHIPYCRRKCLYCDFFSGGASVACWPRLTDALLAELQERVGELPPRLESLYIGGGTPSLMPPVEFRRLMAGVRRIVAEFRREWAEEAEFTIEVNPEDVDEERIRVWQECGISRVSVGIQTFSDPLLRHIGRTHTADEASGALRRLTASFRNVSGDLIFGLPGQDMAQLRRDVERLIAASPQHVSVYTLMYEEGTALTALRDAGRIVPTDDEIVAAQYEALTAMLRDAGFEHYEISNYAWPGYRSRHNSGYWTGCPYLGIGPSAHSYDGSARRRANPTDLFGYLDRFAPILPGSTTDSGRVFYTEETLTEDERREERVMLSLRTAEGLCLESYGVDFGADALMTLLRNAGPHIVAGHLQRAAGRLALTQSGILVADCVIVDLI